MFDVRDNEIWYNNRMFAVIVAHGHASFGWSQDARESLNNQGNAELVQLASIAKHFEEIGNDLAPATDWPSADRNEFTTLLDMPEGLDYTEAEIKAAETLSWYIRPEMRLVFNTLLRAHIRREREQFKAALESLWNLTEGELTE